MDTGKEIPLIPSPNSYTNIKGYKEIIFTPLKQNEAFIYGDNGRVAGITQDTAGKMPVVGYIPLQIKLINVDDITGTTLDIEVIKILPTNVGAGSIP